MVSSLVRKLMFLSSWAMALSIGILVFCMAILCHRAQAVFDDLLGGKPLPWLTDLYLFVHGASVEYGFVALLLVVTTCAFLIHFVASRAKDPLVGVWIWILQAILLALATALYVGFGLFALILPVMSTCCGFQAEVPGSPAEEFFKTALFVAALLGAVVYAGAVAFFMWKMRPKWEANDGSASGS